MRGGAPIPKRDDWKSVCLFPLTYFYYFTKGILALLTNYRAIPVLIPCFSKILERIMYNRLYKFLSENNLLYEKQFGFQANHSTDHAIIQLVDGNI